MTNRSRGIVALTLTALLGVLGAAASLTAPATRPAQLGAGLATGVGSGKPLEPIPVLGRQPASSPQGSAEFAEIAEGDKEKENTGEKDEAAPSAAWAALPRPSGSSRPHAAPGSRGPWASPPGRLFLLCGHLIC